MFGVNNLMFFLQNTNHKEKVEKLSKQDNCGKQLLTLKFKQELHTCFIKMHVIENLINKILELLNQVISVLKSLNTLQNKKLQYVI
jgi:hypothetical protein